MIVGKMLKEIREKAGLSQEQFAEKLAVSRQAVSKWERGIAFPDIENIMYISDLFNVSLDTIVKGDKEMENKIISDNKNTKLLSRLFIGTIVTAVAVTAFIFGFGGLPSIFVPIPIIIIIIFPLFFQYIMYGKLFFTAFSIFSKTNKDIETWKNIKDFFNSYMTVLWMTSILILSIGFIIMLKFLETKEGLAYDLIFMANIVITAGLINLVIITPFKIRIKQTIIKMEKIETMAVIENALMAATRIP